MSTVTTTGHNFLRGPRKNTAAPIQFTTGSLAKVVRRRTLGQIRQTHYAARQRELRSPPVHRIAGALLAAFATASPAQKELLKPITEAMLSRLIEAGYDPDRVKDRVKNLRRRLLQPTGN
ncbi:MAG: hypothetical protein K2Y27_35085 [Xanthobacteraceae bacterium]|nr:hypothetical protein [Xanthobacteraceae bacterium]